MIIKLQQLKYMQGFLVGSRYYCCCCCSHLTDGETETPITRTTHPSSQLVRGGTKVQTQEVWLQNPYSEPFHSAAKHLAHGEKGRSSGKYLGMTLLALLFPTLASLVAASFIPSQPRVSDYPGHNRILQVSCCRG